MCALHDRSGRSHGRQASTAESRSMQPICGAAGKDVFDGINPENREGWQVCYWRGVAPLAPPSAAATGGVDPVSFNEPSPNYEKRNLSRVPLSEKNIYEFPLKGNSY